MFEKPNAKNLSHQRFHNHWLSNGEVASQILEEYQILCSYFKVEVGNSACLTGLIDQNLHTTWDAITSEKIFIHLKG